MVVVERERRGRTDACVVEVAIMELTVGEEVATSVEVAVAPVARSELGEVEEKPVPPCRTIKVKVGAAETKVNGDKMKRKIKSFFIYFYCQ